MGNKYKCYVDVSIKMYLTVDGEDAMLEAPPDGDVKIMSVDGKYGLIVGGVESIGIKLPKTGIYLGKMVSSIMGRTMAAAMKISRDYFAVESDVEEIIDNGNTN